MNARLFEEPRNDTPKAKPEKWSRNVMEKGYEVTCLAEISLAHDLKGGTPSFTDALEVGRGQQLYEYTLARMRNMYESDKIKREYNLLRMFNM
jgi:D-Tyr-tRNAtyr deacylase